MTEIEETRKKCYEILDDVNNFYPYLIKGHFTDNMMKIIIALNKTRPLKELIEVFHEIKKNHYHERTGTTPIDLRPYM